jgi:hypothetical protein
MSVAVVTGIETIVAVVHWHVACGRRVKMVVDHCHWQGMGHCVDCCDEVCYDLSDAK